MKKLLPLFLLLLLPSCMSMISRCGDESFVVPYRSLVYHTLTKEMVGGSHPAMTVFLTVDLPFSLALDTVCLPWDLFFWAKSPYFLD